MTDIIEKLKNENGSIAHGLIGETVEKIEYLREKIISRTHEMNVLRSEYERQIASMTKEINHLKQKVDNYAQREVLRQKQRKTFKKQISALKEQLEKADQYRKADDTLVRYMAALERNQ